MSYTNLESEAWLDCLASGRPGMSEPTFKALELDGWTARAQAYDDWLALVTRQAIEPILAALGGELTDRTLLDICTGTGHLAGAAAARGARAAGADFAGTMVEVARVKYPTVEFLQADAEALPHADGVFDLVTNAFGLWHLEDPDAGLREACRILRSRGRFAFTTWLSPDQGFDLFAIVVAAIRQHGTLELPLPPVPPPFRFADPVEASRSLAAAGFEAVTHERHACLWRTRRGADLLELIYKSLVRAPMLIEHQRVEARMLIQSEIVTRAEAFRSGDGYVELQFPYLLVTATKL
jgi:SAM-dependent methyltransferase